MKFKVKVYDNIKYSSDSKKVAETIYEDVISIETKYISDKDIYDAGFDSVDPYGEYTILTFANGEHSTFRNSFCDVFREEY